MEEIKQKLFNGEIKPYALEKEIFAHFNNDESKWEETCRISSEMRLEFLEKKLNLQLPNIKKCYVNTSGKGITGIEQKIGGASIPLGFAGPLKINGDFAKGEFYVPLATNEAALIAGLSRGMKLVNEANGVNVKVTGDCMTRAPLFITPNTNYASEIAENIKQKGDLFLKMKSAAESKSRFSKLIDIQPFQIANRLWLRHVFQTGDAMGMNSVTKYTSESVKALLGEKNQLKLVALSGNLCADKKSTAMNVLFGRGKSVHAEVFIPKSVLQNVYGLTPESVEMVNKNKNMLGSALAGTVAGFNANIANTIAAIFAACGQDLAQVVESSSGFTVADAKEDGLYFALSMPSLEVGAVGGGTGFGTAKECLSIMKCNSQAQPGENAKKLAEIICTSALCQDLNLLCALAKEFELAESHISLARGTQR